MLPNDRRPTLNPNYELDQIRKAIEGRTDSRKILRMVEEFAREYSGPAYDEGYQKGFEDGYTDWLNTDG